MKANITYVITLKRASDQLSPPWVYRCDHPEDGAERPTTTRDISMAEGIARQHAAVAHPADVADVLIEDD